MSFGSEEEFTLMPLQVLKKGGLFESQSKGLDSDRAFENEFLDECKEQGLIINAEEFGEFESRNENSFDAESYNLCLSSRSDLKYLDHLEGENNSGIQENSETLIKDEKGALSTCIEKGKLMIAWKALKELKKFKMLQLKFKNISNKNQRLLRETLISANLRYFGLKRAFFYKFLRFSKQTQKKQKINKDTLNWVIALSRKEAVSAMIIFQGILKLFKNKKKLIFNNLSLKISKKLRILFGNIIKRQLLEVFSQFWIFLIDFKYKVRLIHYSSAKLLNIVSKKDLKCKSRAILKLKNSKNVGFSLKVKIFVLSLLILILGYLLNFVN
jgi:hypothetical protein